MLKAKFSKRSNKSYEDIHYSCTIRFLDDSEPLTVTYQKDSKGEWLLEHVCKQLNLVENDYFGLRYVDADKQRHWLDLTKTVYRQLKNVTPMVLCFRVKFYPSDPMKLKEEITRYFVFLQLRRDLHHGRLLCSPADANQMAGYIIQSEVGDYDPQDHNPGYITPFKMLPKQTQKQEEKIAEFHKKCRGDVPADAEANFLKKAACLETYGVDPHPVRDQKGNQMYLGVTHLGIVTFQGNKRTHLFKWPQITKIAFEGKMFIVHVYTGEKKLACGFKCATFSACKHLWKCAVEQQYFFTLQAGSEAKKVSSGGSFFTRGSKFRFSGRCQKEVFNDSSEITREEPSFLRSSSNPSFVRSFDKLRSVSLPNKFRDRASLSEISNITGDSNHMMLDSLLVTSTPLEDHIATDTIPEEGVLEIGDSPYRPIQSPSTEELPALPVNEDVTTTEPLAVTGHVPPDLDAQIQQLQRELENCRQPGNHSGEGTDHGTPTDSGFAELPVDVDSLEPVPSNYHPLEPVVAIANQEEPRRGSTDVRELTPHPVEAAKEEASPAEEFSKPAVAPPKKASGILRAFAIGLFATFVIMCIVGLIVLESDMQIPVLKEIRLMPEVQDFKQQRYEPFKSSVSQRVSGALQ